MKTIRITIFFLLIIKFCAGQSGVCRSFRLDGFEKETAYAESILGTPTTDVKKLKVFITASKSYLFIQSNFSCIGYESTSKLVSDELLEPSDIVLNLICSDYNCPYKDKINQILETTQFFVDKVAINQSIYSKLDFSVMKRISLPQTNIIDSFQMSSTHPQEKVKIDTPQNDKIIKFDDKKATETPKDFTSAAIDLFYHSTLGKILLVFILLLVSVFIVWKSLPEDAKSKVLNYFFSKRKAKQEETKINNPSSDTADKSA